MSSMYAIHDFGLTVYLITLNMKCELIVGFISFSNPEGMILL
jgi:hypothetical protein